MFDLLQLETFRVVATTRNFTRAAAELGCSQSTVTTRIKVLERELSAHLLERSRFSKHVALTDAGRRTLQYAGRIFGLAHQIEASATVARASIAPAK